MITNLNLPIKEEKRRKKKMQIGSNIHNNQRGLYPQMVQTS
jgi:hypothetical protein